MHRILRFCQIWSKPYIFVCELSRKKFHISEHTHKPLSSEWNNTHRKQMPENMYSSSKSNPFVKFSGKFRKNNINEVFYQRHLSFRHWHFPLNLQEFSAKVPERICVKSNWFPTNYTFFAALLYTFRNLFSVCIEAELLPQSVALRVSNVSTEWYMHFEVEAWKSISHYQVYVSNLIQIFRFASGLNWFMMTQWIWEFL